MEDNLTEEERQQSIRHFRSREQGRFRTGEYLRCIGLLEDMDFRLAYESECQRTGVPHSMLHYLHWSVKDPEMVAYTPSLEYGIRDRQVRVKLGRYLSKHFGHLLSEKKRLELVEKHNATALANCKFHIAMTPGRIEAVYTHGPSSCMGYSRHHFAHNFHPTRIYGAGDLGVAFMWRQDTDGRQRITARALVWPDKMIHGRVYGDESRFKAMLIDRGYVEDWRGFDGAAVLYKPEIWQNVPHAPYIDADLGLSMPPYDPDVSGILLLTDERLAEWRCKNTNGLAGSFCTCVACDDAVDEDDALHDDDGDSYCESCFLDQHSRCDGCDEWTRDDQLTDLDDCNYCHCCYENEAATCEDCGDTTHSHNLTCSDHDWSPRCDDCHDDHEQQIQNEREEEEENEAA